MEWVNVLGPRHDQMAQDTTRRLSPLLWHVICYHQFKPLSPNIIPWHACHSILNDLNPKTETVKILLCTRDNGKEGGRKLVWIWSLMDDSSYCVTSRHWQWRDFDLDFVNGNWLHITKTDKRSFKRRRKIMTQSTSQGQLFQIHPFWSLHQQKWAAVKEFHSKLQQQPLRIS